MVFENIERLKDEYTDKYVQVDNSQPELARFEGLTGRVKTVNMSGRALVEFDDYALNIGWFDIELDFLKVVDGPAPTGPALKKSTKTTAPTDAKPKKEASALGKKRADAGKAGAMSTADILAMARGGGDGKAAPKKATSEKEKPKAAEKAAPAKGAGAMSVEEMLAAARASAKGETAAAPAAKAEPAAEPTPPAESTPEPVAETPAPAPEESAPEPAPATAASGDLPKDVDGILAYCRQADGS